MAEKFFVNTPGNEGTIIIEADYFEVIDDKLKFYSGEGDSQELVAVFAKGQWNNVRKGPLK